MGRRLFHVSLVLLLLALLVIGAIAFSVIGPTIGRGRFLRQSALITAASTSSPTRLTTPTLPIEPTVQQTDPPALVKLALRYQPTVVVSARDRFWPVSVLDTLHFRWGRKRTCLFRGDRCRLMPPKVSDLTQQRSSPSDYLQFPARVNRVTDQFVSSARAVGVPDAAIRRWRRTPTSVNPFPSAQIYFYYLDRAPDHAYRGVPDGLASLEYWFYFPLNYLATVKTPLLTLVDPIGTTVGNSDLHQGDFEHVAVLLDRRTKRPRYLWMARHGDEGLAYNVTRGTVESIAARDGVMGLIMGDHLMADGLRPEPAKGERRTVDFNDSFELLCTHIDTINEWSGRPFRHVGIGSDLDGFIKPTLAGVETAEDMCKLEVALADRYGPASADQICSGNALRMLYDYRWPS